MLILDERNPLVRLGIEADNYVDALTQYNNGEIGEKEFKQIKARYFSMTEMYGNVGGD